MRPGTDLALLSSLLHVVDRDGLLDGDFVRLHTSGWEEARAVAREWSPMRAAAVCGVDPDLIEEAAHRFASAGGAMALWSMGANQSTVGTLKNRALINLCLATGQIGRPGSGPLSLTGQPNAMGGRETGGLAHLLPGYRKVTDADDRAAMAAHWGVGVENLSPTPGLPAVALFDALEAGTVKAVWIMATNPLVSLPDNQRARAALERAELVVVQDPHHPTETSSLAHAVLPAAAWPEKEGTTTSSERRIGLVAARHRAARRGTAGLADRRGPRAPSRLRRRRSRGPTPPPSSTSSRPAPPAARATSAASRTSGCGARAGCSGRARHRPVDAHAGTTRLYADKRFPTPDGRARFAPTPHVDPAETPDPDFPILLTTGRVADQWHTMTRTGPLPRAARRRRASRRSPSTRSTPRRRGIEDGRQAPIVARAAARCASP